MILHVFYHFKKLNTFKTNGYFVEFKNISEITGCNSKIENVDRLKPKFNLFNNLIEVFDIPTIL